MMFVRLVETNDWEGETWSWWLQVDGNEEALEALSVLLDDEEWEEYLYLSGIVVPEADVDILIRHGGRGYYPDHIKVVGVLTLPVDFEVSGLYKGGIRDYFREAE